MDLIKALNEKQLKEVPQVQVGDTVRVHVKVKEGSRERIQVFEGTVIAKKHGGIEETITAVSPTVWAWRRCSPYILPLSRPSRPCVTVSCAAPSCTICVTASARPPRSARSCKRIRSKKSRLLMRAVFSFSFHENCGIIG